MEALGAALRGKGKLYQSGLQPGVLAQLAGAADKHGLEAKKAAAAFDKFMAVSR